MDQKDEKTKESVDLKTAFKYPFNRRLGLLNVLLILVPVIGLFVSDYMEHIIGFTISNIFILLWDLFLAVGLFAFVGYKTRVIRDFVKGQFKELPILDFSNDLRLGFLIFMKGIPFFGLYIALMSVLYMLGVFFGAIASFLFVSGFLSILIIPILTINFLSKGTVSSYFEFSKLKLVFENPVDYFIALLKELVLGVIYLAMIIVLIGIPALLFTRNLFISDFYRRHTR